MYQIFQLANINNILIVFQLDYILVQMNYIYSNKSNHIQKNLF